MWPSLAERPPTRLVIVLLLSWGVLTVAGCVPRPPSLPSGPGQPYADYQSAFTQATAACRGVRTLTAELTLSGRTGSSRMRGRVVAGFERPDSLRLEAVAPFGAPAFLLVAQGGQATLLLPRENRVLTEAAPAAVVEALAGITLDPALLPALLTGCLTPDPTPLSARAYGRGFLSIDLEGSATAFLKVDQGAWRVEAGTRDGLTVAYSAFLGGLPRQVRLWSPGQRDQGASTLDVGLSQLEINVPVPSEAFRLTIPPDAVPLTLEELRQTGPLAERRQ